MVRLEERSERVAAPRTRGQSGDCGTVDSGLGRGGVDWFVFVRKQRQNSTFVKNLIVWSIPRSRSANRSTDQDGFCDYVPAASQAAVTALVGSAPSDLIDSEIVNVSAWECVLIDCCREDP